MAFENAPVHRQIYAKQMMSKAGIAGNERLLRAFAAVAREDFVGPPPWFFSEHGGYREVPSRDPVVLYQDVLIGLDRGRHVNNGSPSLHATAIHALGVREGEAVVHLGAGTGYYSAILAELSGPSGRVLAVEYDEVLAERARENLRGYRNVTVIEGDAMEWPKEDADVIYANFALDHPPAAWIDNLAVSGRALFPLGVPAYNEAGKALGTSRWAAFLMIDRRPGRFGARFLQPVQFVWAEGQEAPPPGRHQRLADAFRGRGLYRIRSLRWRAPPRAHEWYGEEDWGLSFEEA